MNKTFIKPQCFLRAYYVLVSVLVTRDIKMKKRSHSLMERQVYGEVMTI